jgi:hypothetical protein
MTAPVWTGARPRPEPKSPDFGGTSRPKSGDFGYDLLGHGHPTVPQPASWRGKGAGRLFTKLSFPDGDSRLSLLRIR